MRQKAKEAARKKAKERKELEKKLGIPDTGISYDLEAYMKDKELIKKNRAAQRKLRGYQKEMDKVIEEMEIRNKTQTQQAGINIFKNLIFFY